MFFIFLAEEEAFQIGHPYIKKSAITIIELTINDLGTSDSKNDCKILEKCFGDLVNLSYDNRLANNSLPHNSFPHFKNTINFTLEATYAVFAANGCKKKLLDNKK